MVIWGYSISGACVGVLLVEMIAAVLGEYWGGGYYLMLWFSEL